MAAIRNAALAVAAGLAACTPDISSKDTGFKSQYVVSRNALESGAFPKAVRGYGRLLDQAGPLRPRIRLEFSHALLRSGDFEGAARESRVLSESPDAKLRASALAVFGTARHEAARDTGNATDLRAARDALKMALSLDPDLDRVGGLAARIKAIEVRLPG